MISFHKSLHFHIFLISNALFTKDQVSIGVWVYFGVFDSIPLMNLSESVPIPHVFIAIAWKYNLRSGMMISPRRSFIVTNCFYYTGFSFFHMHLRITLSVSVKNCIGILMGIIQNLQIAFGKMFMLTLLIHEHGSSFL